MHALIPDTADTQAVTDQITTIGDDSCTGIGNCTTPVSHYHPRGICPPSPSFPDVMAATGPNPSRKSRKAA